jgi:hypothetical protein
MTSRPGCTTAQPQRGSTLLAAPLIACTLLTGACSSATSPTKLEPPPGAYRSVFAALKGETGFAGISVTPKAIPEAHSSDISIRVMGLKANTCCYSGTRGVGGRPLGGDGFANAPQPLSWSSSDAAALSFQTVPLPNTGPLISVTTAANGDGSLDFEFRTLMLLAGTTNDVMYRLIDNDTAPTTELRSTCMTITAK